ncbi:Hpt domain-containing protein [Undibacterium sp. Xuan67W]|uniref:Hpt domain-containing protein n=1 Tax=Undibacterium sp. Xuan67W TaxID=3413057 RepID=UPI003BF01D78
MSVATPRNGESPHERGGVVDQFDSVFDVARLDAMCVAHASFRIAIDGLVQKVIDRGLTPIDEARDAWSSGRGDEVRTLFHTLRGTLGILGAIDFQNAARQIETAIQDRRDEQVQDLLEIVKQRLQEVIESARQWTQRSLHQSKHSALDKLESATLNELKTLLTQKNMRSCDLYVQLRPSLVDIYSETTMRDADHAMQHLDFARILSLLG